MKKKVNAKETKDNSQIKNIKTAEEIIRIDKSKMKEYFGEFVRETVEESLNALLEAQANELCGARKYERSPDRVDQRAGHYKRGLHTQAGNVTLKVPKLRYASFETQIIERYRRRESSVEEALVEMYLAGVSVRRVEDITEALWGTRVSPSTVSQLNQKIYEQVEKWRNRPLKGSYRYVFIDGIWLKRSWGGEVKNVSVLIAMGVNEEGYREFIGVSEGMKEDSESWREFLKELKARGLKGVDLFISDKCLGLLEALGQSYPQAAWQRCVVHFQRNVFRVVPRGKWAIVGAMLKAIHAQEDKEAAIKKAAEIVEKLKGMKLYKASQTIETGIKETVNYYDFPVEHQKHLRTNNPLERIMKEIRRRTRVVGSFPDGQSALMLVCARLRYLMQTKWGQNRYLDMDKNQQLQEAA